MLNILFLFFFELVFQSRISKSKMSTPVKEESIDIDDDAGEVDPVSCHISLSPAILVKLSSVT